MKMGRYNKFQSRRKERPEVNPLWRGVGCILMVALPLITFGLTVIFTPPIAATGLVPLQLLGQVNFPAWVFRTPVLGDIAIFIRGINNLGLDVMVFLIFLLLLTGISSLIYVSVLQVIGPPRYTEIDAPPSRYKAKPYKR
jgi:hypothetical protein